MSGWAALARSVGPPLAGLAVVLLVLGLAGSAVTPLAGEAAVLSAVAEVRSAGLTTAAHAVTLLGDLWLVLLAAVVVAAAVRRSPDALRIHAVLLLAIGGSTLIVGVLKLVVGRERPAEALISSISASYPSGHGARAAVVFGLLAWAWHRTVDHRGRRVALVMATGVVATAVAASRVYLAVHLPSEALAGVLIGGVWTAAVLRLTGPAERYGEDGAR